jgi:hypothetical protein
MKSWLDRTRKLKQQIAQSPDQQIPEFKLLKDQDWLNAVKDISQLETPADYAKAVSQLKSEARNNFANALQQAFGKFAQDNNGQMPNDFSQLTAYLGDAGDSSILEKYQFTEPGSVEQKAHFEIDPEGNYYSTDFQISQNSISSSNHSGDDLKQAIQAFLAANPGQTLTDPNQLVPYAQTAAEKAALQEAMSDGKGPGSEPGASTSVSAIQVVK